MSEWPEHWMDLPLAAIDVETTGFDAESDRIIEIGIIRFERGEVTDTYGQLIDPGRSVPEKVTEITGIKDENLKGMPSFADVSHEVWSRLQGVGIVAYNLSFDRSFVQAELAR
ncbi:MAG: 3'-5' exonuclease, partial [Myxococcota bacterium]